MCKAAVTGGRLLALALTTAVAQPAVAGVVAGYRDDFRASGQPRVGWSYRWNAAGPIEETLNVLNEPALASLVRDTSGNLETVANETYPDPAPGNGLAATPTSLFPGPSATESGGISRWAIASYTIQPYDVATFGSSGIMDTYSFAVPAGSVDGVTARMYLNGNRIVQSPLPGNFVYDQNSPGAYPIPFGELKAGDVIAVALGAGATSIGDRLDLDFTITLGPGSVLPNPAAAADANGDGKLNIDDYFHIDLGRANGLGGFANGDFDGSGSVDGDDYFIIDRAFAELLPTGGGMGAASVPEPAIGLTILIGAAPALRRRRR
jgi:hypothetical protein